MRSIRTDMADESRAAGPGPRMLQEQGVQDGIRVEQDGDDQVSITRVHVVSPLGEQNTGKPMGTYVTMDMPAIREQGRDLYEKACRMLAAELEKMVRINDMDTVLVVGLGNWNVTADSLGPRVCSHLMVTRHLHEYLPEEVDDGVRPVCAIAPGVLGLTGIETGHIIKGVVDQIKPAMVIAVDALASRNMNRVNASVQLANTGIAPGSGIGNKRMAIAQETLGVPVIAIGIPTVVDAATIVSDTIDLMMDSMKKQSPPDSGLFNMLSNIDLDDKYQTILNFLEPYSGNLVVTPKDADEIVEFLSKMVANGINMALHKNIDAKDVDRFIQ
ncbi:MAG TPA: GPR endopeptidase [Thermoclostridium sp.]|nr:GPR endopeptidase [Thermoclostridium sp.]